MSDEFWSDLESRIAADGVDAVLTRGPAAGGELPDDLRRVLELEAHHVRGWDRAGRPEFLVQQVLTRADALGLSELVRSARRRIDAVRHVVVCERWRTQPFSPALVRSLSGRGPGIRDAAFAPDGRLYSVADDGDLRVWDVAKGTSRRVEIEAPAPRARPTQLAVSADGALLAVSFTDMTIVVLSLADGDTVTVGRHEEWVHSLRFFPGESRRLASSAGDGTVAVWDVGACRRLRTFAGHTSAARSLTIGRDGTTVVSGSRDGTLRVWDVDRGECRQVVIDGDDGDVFAVAFADDDRSLLASSQYGAVHRYDVRGGQLHGRTRLGAPQPERRGPGWPWSITPLGRGRAMVTNDDAVVDLLATNPTDPRSARITSLTGHGDHTRVGAVSADGRLAVTGDEDGQLLLWDVDAPSTPDPPLGLYFGVERIAVSGDGTRVASSPQQELRVVVRDTRTDAQLWRFHVPDGGGPDCLWFSRYGATVYTADGSTVRRHAAETGTVERSAEMPGNVRIGRGDLVVVVESSYRPAERFHLAVADAGTGFVRRSVTLPPDFGYPGSVAASPDLSTVVAASDGFLTAWWTASGETTTVPVRSPADDGGERALDVLEVAVDDEGCHVLACDENERTLVWDVDTGDVVVAAPDNGRVRAVGGLPGHRAVTAGAEDGVVTVWDLSAVRPVCATPLDSAPSAIMVDGHRIAVGDGGGNAHLLELVEGGSAPATPVPAAPRASAPAERPSLLTRLFGRS